MFLYLLNENEGKAFMELSNIAIKLDNEIQEWEKAEVENYLAELSLNDFNFVGLTLEEAIKCFKHSTVPVKRSVIIELYGILYSHKDIDNKKQTWIYSLAERLGIKNEETERLVRWSKDFSDFLEIGLMYINAKS